MSKGNLTKKQRRHIERSRDAAYDTETSKRLASCLDEAATVLRESYEWERQNGDEARPMLEKLLRDCEAALKRYREGR